MSDDRGNGLGTLLLAFLAGAAVGAAVAMLTSPKSGPEMRDTITGAGKDLQKKMKKAVDDLTSAAGEVLDEDIG